MGKHNRENDTEMVDIYSSAKKGKKAAKKRKSKKTKTQKIIITILSVLVGFCILVSGLLIFALNYFKYEKTDVDEDALGVQTENSEDYVKNIALFGIDTRNQASMTGLSDSIMIMSVDTKNKTIKLVSVMRDSVVRVNGKVNKINAAYSTGGHERAIKTLNENFGLDITDYATVNFSGMIGLIDMVGGIEAEVTRQEFNRATAYGSLNDLIREQARLMGLKNPELVDGPGKQMLTGIQAVAWSRIRMQATAQGERDDYGRTARQRHVLNELFSRAANMSITKYPKFVKKLLPYVETSLSYKEIIKLAPVIKGGTLQGERIPCDNSQISGASSGVAGGVYYNLDYASNLIKAFLYEGQTFEEYIALNPIDKTPWVY